MRFGMISDRDNFAFLSKMVAVGHLDVQNAVLCDVIAISGRDSRHFVHVLGNKTLTFSSY
jgi:hypothetical protein